MQVLDIVWFAVNFSVLMYSKKSCNFVDIFVGELIKKVAEKIDEHRTE